jgi:hypothetical protein
MPRGDMPGVTVDEHVYRRAMNGSFANRDVVLT